MRGLWDMLKLHQSEFSSFKDHVSERYVKTEYVSEMKGDIKGMSDAIFRKLDRIEEKIDNKMDKIPGGKS